MQVVECRSQDDLDALRPAWEALIPKSTAPSTVNTWHWAKAWWSTYGRDGDLRLLKAVDDIGEVRGIAPLQLRSGPEAGRPWPRLTWIGADSNDSDYLDFIVAATDRVAALSAFWSYLLGEIKRGAVVALPDVHAASANLPVLMELARGNGVIWAETPVPCGVVQLPDDWEEYLRILRPRFRTKVRSALRALELRREARFAFCRSAEEVDRLLSDLFELHARRWAQEGKPGVFGSEVKRQFYGTLSRLLLESGRLWFSRLEWNGQVIACQYGFTEGPSYYQLQEGYEPACEHLSVGLALRAWSIREMIGAGIRTYDFLAGVGRHKTDWGAEVKSGKSIVIAPNTLSGQWICRRPELEAQVRSSVRAMVPESILTLRNRRIKQGAQPPCSSDKSRRLVEGAAWCYSSFGLPGLFRPIRERYRISLPSPGNGVALERRAVPSGRILYYHRVNDARDPFSPAMSTAVFERQMKFIAQHYRVVSLQSLIEHLEGDSPGTVVAVTFDDGYEDNYRCALPILQRYRIPATIFLTTGAIDSGEPVWFERLADAIKRTARESVQFEIDIPRRLSLRTTQERLEANARIFGLLRRLPDASRLESLDRILSELAVPVTVQASMLSWNQIREMCRLQIDFGGHTVSHPFLSQVQPETAKWEVAECKRRIEEELQSEVRFFAYPNGRPEDFTLWNKEIVRQAGYRAAATTIWGMNDRGTDSMELRRGQPWEEGEAMFELKLDWYQFSNA